MKQILVNLFRSILRPVHANKLLLKIVYKDVKARTDCKYSIVGLSQSKIFHTGQISELY